MKDSRQIEVLAEAEGYDLLIEDANPQFNLWKKNGVTYLQKHLPRYLDPKDHNPIQRVSGGLDDKQSRKYWLTLNSIMAKKRDAYVSNYEMAKATVPQQCGAAIKALGKWED